MYVRVRNEVGHEFSTPVNDPLIGKGVLTVVGRKGLSRLPLRPKYKKTLPPLGGMKNEEATDG